MQNVVDHLVSLFGSQEKVAKAAGVAQSSVAEWKARNVVPTRRVRKILAAAKAKRISLKMDDLLPADPGTKQ